MRTAVPLLLLLFLCGCSYTKPLGKVVHPDGTNYTAFYYVRAGGALGPGLGAIVSQTTAGNAPVVLVQGTGAPMAPSLLGGVTSAAAGFFAGYAVGDNNDDRTTVIQGESRAPMMEPPKPPAPPPVHPPNGRPPNNRPPNNRPKTK